MNGGETNLACGEICLFSTDHRPERLSAKDMNVQMRHFLSAMRADIGHQPVSRFD
jgi:hypothetical protein